VRLSECQTDQILQARLMPANSMCAAFAPRGFGTSTHRLMVISTGNGNELGD
jgi:hypothetical protein